MGRMCSIFSPEQFVNDDIDGVTQQCHLASSAICVHVRWIVCHDD